MPVVQPTTQRYTAGSCILEVTVTPSVLSQWSQQLIAESLTFKVWLEERSSAENASVEKPDLRLVGEGNAHQFQAIARYIQHKTQHSLALVHLGRTEPSASAITYRSVPPSPQSEPSLDGLEREAFFPPEPLSYLQLCDLHTVLSQCEQTVQMLPASQSALEAALSTATPEVMARATADTQLQSPETVANVLEQQTVGDSGVNNRPSTQNLPAARNLESYTAVPSTRNKIISLEAFRRRPKIWASTAAAAVLAIGLTSTLINRNLVQTDARIAAESSSEEALLEQNGSRADNQVLLPPVTSQQKSPNTTAPGRAETSDRNNRTSAIPSGRVPQSPTAAPDAVARRPRTETNRPATGLPSSASPSASVPASPSPSTNDSAATLPQPVESATAEENRIIADSSRRTNDDVGAAEATPPDVVASSPVPEDGSFSSVPNPSAAADTGDSQSTESQLQGSTNNEPESLAAARQANRPSIREPNSANQPSGRVESIARMPESLSEDSLESAGADIEIAQESEAVALPELAISSEAEAIAQVQQYFLGQWQAEEDGPLRYQLQLSAAGEVISFAALDERSQMYRDRILPTDMPPSFTPPNNGQGLTLQLTFTAGGQVQVDQN